MTTKLEYISWWILLFYIVLAISSTSWYYHHGIMQLIDLFMVLALSLILTYTATHPNKFIYDTF